MLGISLLSVEKAVRLAAIAGLFALALTMATLVDGEATKGARRWIDLAGFSLQPSEFLKPCFAVAAGFLIARGGRHRSFPGKLLALGLFAVIGLLLADQPDIGMLVVITGVFVMQLYLGGVNPAVVGAMGLAGVAALLATYWLSPAPMRVLMRFCTPPAPAVCKSTRLWKPLPMAACGGAARARAILKIPCPTPTPISCLPWPGKSWG